MLDICSCQAGSICERERTGYHLPCASGQTTCLLKWSGLWRGSIWTKLGTKVRGVKSLHYLDLEVGLNAQRQDGIVPKGM
jgi:hypothetical protein